MGLDQNAHPTNLVAGLTVVIVLVTSAPHDVGKSCLGLIFEMFWRMVYWEPKREQDSVHVEYLRATLYSLFTRLYTLFPCNVVHYLRTHTVGMTRKPFFIFTLQPMIERVRLHPMLFTHTKEQELDKLYTTPDGAQALMSCGRLTLDPMETSCEEPPIVMDPEVCSSSFVETNKCWLHSTSENFFWSPSHTQSPQPVRMEHTPQQTPLPTPSFIRSPLRANVSLTIPESPPEKAVEATPETTPYTTPLLSDINKQILAQNINLPNLSPMFSNAPQSDGASAYGNDMAAIRNKSMSNRLSALKRERRQVAEEPATAGIQQFGKIKSAEGNTSHNGSNESNQLNLSQENVESYNNYSTTIIDKDNVNSETTERATNNKEDVLSTSACPEVAVPPVDRPKASRSRKSSVYVPPAVDMLQFSGKVSSPTRCDLPAALTVDGEDYVPAGEVAERGDDLRRVSTETNESGNDVEDDTSDDQNQGLGPSHAVSISDIVRSAKSNRLRFLSQCGPPLTVAQIDSIMPENSKTSKLTAVPRPRSNSCSNINIEFPQKKLVQPTRKVSFVSGPKLLVDSADKETQTTSIPSFDPFEKLIDTFVATAKVPSVLNNDPSQVTDEFPQTDSPHILLDNYIKRKVIDCSEPLVGFDFSKIKSGDDRLKNQVYSMYCLLLLERQKREFHANRNRRLLAKSKRMHVLAEQKIGLTQQIETYLEEARNLKSSNIYTSSCYQRMKDARDRDNTEREAVLKEYGEGKELTSSKITSLSRTVKTSKGDELKEKVIVILHRSVESDEDSLKDELFHTIASMSGELLHLTEENKKLHLRVCELEQAATKYQIDQKNIATLQHEKEMMRQHMAIMKIQLTLKDEVFLESSQQLSSLQDLTYDLQRKMSYENETWSRQEEAFLREHRALQGMASAVGLRLRQLEAQLASKSDEHERELSDAKHETDVQRNKVVTVEESNQLLKKHNRDLEMRLKQLMGERDMLNKELRFLAGRSGYSRSPPSSVPHTASSNNFASASLSTELKPLWTCAKK